MKTIKEIYTSTIIIQKSEFICHIFPVSTVEEANTYLANTRKKYYDATHNCYGYIIGNNGEIAKYSDDGEPSQTAGVVIYDVLKKNELTNVLAIVTRYFGGIKLGAGGLVRAYSSSTANTLLDIKTYELTPCIRMELRFPYTYMNLVSKYLSDCTLISKSFDSFVNLIYELPKKDFEEINKNLISMTKNEIDIKITSENTKAI